MGDRYVGIAVSSCIGVEVSAAQSGFLPAGLAAFAGRSNAQRDRPTGTSALHPSFPSWSRAPAVGAQPADRGLSQGYAATPAVPILSVSKGAHCASLWCFRDCLDLILEPLYHASTMTKLLEDALEAIRQLPANEQDEIARAMMALAGGRVDGEPVPLTPAELAAIARSKAAAARGEFASEEQVRAVWAKHGL